MRTLIEFLAQRGTRRLTGFALRENAAMRALARQIGFAADEAGSSLDALKIVLALPSTG